MNYLTLSRALRKHNLRLFSLRDLQNLFPAEKEKTLKNNLSRWIKRADFLRLRRNLYELAEPDFEGKIPDLYVANRLYEPSYVSLETALSIYSIIPDIAAQVTSVTTRPTRAFKNRYGSFYFRACKRQAFTGYRLIDYEGSRVLIAEPEKALVDFLYYRLRSGTRIDFEEERLNKTILRKINWKKALRQAAFFSFKTEKSVKQLRKFVRC